MNINNLHWHDGNITKFEFTPNYDGEPQILITVNIYDDTVRTPGRDAFLLKCVGVVRFNCSCDVIELNDNSEAGSINNCTLKGSILRFHLFGGFIEIEAKLYQVEKC